jgi:hypothetical protein
VTAPEEQADEVLSETVRERVRALMDVTKDVAPAADALEAAIDRVTWKALSAKLVELWGHMADTDDVTEMCNLALKIKPVKAAQARVALMVMSYPKD